MKYLMGLIALVLFLGTADNAAHAAGSDADSVYQIIKAENNRVWRLNKVSGEIAVCTLEGENLVCTNSTEAIKPPSKTYAEREAERKMAMEEAKKRRDDQKLKDLQLLDKVITAVRSLMKESIEREAPVK